MIFFSIGGKNAADDVEIISIQNKKKQVQLTGAVLYHEQMYLNESIKTFINSE